MKKPSPHSRLMHRSIGLLLSLFPWQPLCAVEDLSKNGEAILAIMPDANNVQLSNYGKKSFTVSNTGSKDIVLFRLDVTESLFPDGVFDPEGIAGDSASKKIEIDEDMDTGIIVPSGISRDVYIGQGGPAGYKTIQLRFRDNGFNPGEKMAFSVDMDPNSAAGTEKSPLDAGSDPKWDVGGVSGAELIGSVFTVTFSDGSTASGQLGGTVTQAGSRGIASQIPRSQKVDLRVNGIAPGNVGNYSAGGPEIQVNGPAGTTARVIVAKGFIQPFTPYNPQLERQLKALANRSFPVNNAVEILTVDIEMTGSPINVSDRFNFSEVAKYDFKSEPSKPLSVDEDKLSLGITAAIIDKNQDGLPLGPLTKPIYLNYQSPKSKKPSYRYAYSSDGYNQDRDDIAASAMMLALLDRAGLTDKLVHFNFNTNFGGAPTHADEHRKSVLETAVLFGISKDLKSDGRFYDVSESEATKKAAIAHLAGVIRSSKASDPLMLFCPGGVQVHHAALQQAILEGASPETLKSLVFVSHSSANEKTANDAKPEYENNWPRLKELSPTSTFIDGSSSLVNGKRGGGVHSSQDHTAWNQAPRAKKGGVTPWQWLKGYGSRVEGFGFSGTKGEWLLTRLKAAGKPELGHNANAEGDSSDAGMVFGQLPGGNTDATMDEIRDYFIGKTSMSDETGFVPLFDGKTLNGWTSAENTGERNWGDFTVNEAEKAIHVYAGKEEGSKQEHNCLNTEKEYSHYILKLEYKWGGKRFAPRADWDRDAGLLFHVHGDLKKIWPASLEMQIGETPGDSPAKGRRFHTGDLFVLAGNLRVERPVKDGFYHPEGTRSMGGHVPTKFGVEKPMGEWNEMEIRVEGAEKATFIFNGEVVFEIFNMQQKIGDDFLPLDKGRIGLQAEWAEILYRNIRIKELPSK